MPHMSNCGKTFQLPVTPGAREGVPSSRARPPFQSGGNGESMRAEEYRILEELLQELQPQRTLEVGWEAAQQRCICRILQALGGGKHVAIDPYQSARRDSVVQAWIGCEERAWSATSTCSRNSITLPCHACSPGCVV